MISCMKQIGKGLQMQFLQLDYFGFAAIFAIFYQ